MDTNLNVSFRTAPFGHKKTLRYLTDSFAELLGRQPAHVQGADVRPRRVSLDRVNSRSTRKGGWRTSRSYIQRRPGQAVRLATPPPADILSVDMSVALVSDRADSPPVFGSANTFGRFARCYAAGKFAFQSKSEF
jgi:hypothetical protein